MSGDVNFEPKLQRTINVDIRYVLFIIDKYAGATNLISELDIRKSEPQPIREEEEIVEPVEPEKEQKGIKAKGKTKK